MVKDRQSKTTYVDVCTDKTIQVSITFSKSYEGRKHTTPPETT